ncbi:MAG: PKD domain-containing protein [Planctomycetota bacterium]
MASIRFLAPVLIGALAAGSTAQTVQTLPAGYLNKEGSSSSSYPFNTSNMRVQYVYDSTYIKHAGPVLISRLRIRANGSTTATWTGGTLAGVVVRMSSSPFNYNLITTNFANNHGSDLATVFSGSVKVLGQTSSTIPQKTWYVDIKLPTPFKYDPSLGKDILIDYSVGAYTGGSRWPQDVTFTSEAERVTRMYAFSPNATTGTLQPRVGLITEISWVPAKGLFSNFTATPRAGAGPLKVQFTDATFSSNPPIKTWAWDFDGDKVIDSRLQKPLPFTYKSVNKTAQYSVTLTTTDGTNPPSTITKPNYITVDPPPKASFTAAPTLGKVPMLVKFTDTSFAATGWKWDFQNDGIVDATTQNPTFPYTTPGKYSVKLEVSNVAGTNAIVRTDLITAVGATANTTSPEILQYQFNDLREANIANSSSTTLAPENGGAAQFGWQADPGRTGYGGPEKGAGCLGIDSTTPYDNRIDTGWPLKIIGSMTIEWWQRMGTTAPGSSLAYCWGSGSSFRCFTGGVASTSLWFRGSPIGDIKASKSVQAAPNKWQHAALVIDDKAGNAIWYIDGVLDTTTTFTPGTFKDDEATAGGFKVGWHSSTSSVYTRYYQMDDFRFYSHARTATQIKADMSQELATTSRFDKGCNGTLGVPLISANSTPTAGNATFAFTVDKTETGKPGILIMGFAARKLIGIVPLPWSLDFVYGPGSGCKLNVDQTFTWSATGNGGKISIGVPLPSGIEGLHAYVQWLAFGSVGAVSKGLDVNFQK